MEDKTRKTLADRFGYETWREAVGGEGLSLIRGFAPAEGQVPGWIIARTERDVVDSQPRLRMILRRPVSPSDQLITIKVVECTSRAAARSFLLKSLGEFQSPMVARTTDAGVGDVAFAAGPSMMIFGRANIVVHVANAGLDIVPVQEIARATDSLLRRLGGQHGGS